MAGIITTANNYKNVLRETDRDIFGNPTWRQAYTNIELQQQKAEAQVNRQFGEAIGKAYEAANAQAANVSGSALGEGYKDMLLSENQATLNAAYDQYMANLAEAQGTLSQTYGEAKTQLDEMLSERAKNMKALETEYGKYWTATDKWFAENLSPEDYAKQASGAMWKPFYKYDKESDTYTAKTYEELSQPTYDSETGEWVSIYDADGNITDVGRDFFDIMTNYYAQQAATEDQALPQSFAQYLAGSNADLYNWASSYDPYSWSPVMTAEGEFLSTNIGRFKQIMGLESNDQTYSYVERLTGAKQQELDKTFDDLIAKYGTEEKLSDKAVTESYTDFKQLATKLGVSGADWDNIEKSAKRMADQYEAAGGELTSNTWITILSLAIQGSVVAASAVTGGAAGLALTGAAMTPGSGKTLMDSALTDREIRRMKNATKKEIHSLYLNSIAVLANEAYRTSPEKQAEYQTKLEKEIGKLDKEYDFNDYYGFFGPWLFWHDFKEEAKNGPKIGLSWGDK